MLIYLDTSNLFDAMKGRIDLSTLRSDESATLVFSEAHFDDAGGGGTRGFEEVAAFISTWPRRLYAFTPRLIPSLELAAFASAAPHPPDRTPALVLSTFAEIELLLSELTDPAGIPDAVRATNDSQLAELSTIRHVIAKAQTISKRAAAIEAKNEVTTPEEDAITVIDSINRSDDETIALLKKSLEMPIPPFPLASPYVGPAQEALWYDMSMLQRRYLRAGLNGDVPELIQTMKAQRDLKARIDADPVIGPFIAAAVVEDVRWRSFQVRCVTGNPAVSQLEPVHLRQLYDAMVAHPDLCPGWTLVWKVESRMARDAQTPSKGSDDVDLAHLALLPSVDALFVDTRIYTYVQQAKDIDPETKAKCLLAKHLKNWLTERDTGNGLPNQ